MNIYYILTKKYDILTQMIRLSEDKDCESWVHLETALTSGEILVVDIGVTGALISKDVNKLRQFKDRPHAPVSAWGDITHYWNNRNLQHHNHHNPTLSHHFYGKSFLRFILDKTKFLDHQIPHEAINDKGYLQIYGYNSESDEFLHRVQQFILDKLDNYYIYVTSTNKRALQTIRGEEDLKKWCYEHNIKFFSLPEHVRDLYKHRGSYPIIEASTENNQLKLMRKGWIDIYNHLKKLEFDIIDLTE